MTQPAQGRKDERVNDTAIQFLTGALKGKGPRLSADVQEEAAKAKLSPEQVRRARLHLPIQIARTQEIPPKTTWELEE
jgi:hypothetical protein